MSGLIIDGGWKDIEGGGANCSGSRVVSSSDREQNVGGILQGERRSKTYCSSVAAHSYRCHSHCYLSS